MKFMKSKIQRMMIGFTVFVTMIFSAVPAFAEENNGTESLLESPAVVGSDMVDSVSIEPRAGAETWVGSGFGGSYTFINYNLTPVKTMGASGTLLIYGTFYGDDGYSDVSPIKLTCQIRSTSGAVKAQTVRVDDRSGAVAFAVSSPVSKGEQIQLYFDASSIANPPGIYRSANVSYNYDLY